jgi:3-hydroxyacyl-[acyl-carrier-protein] dehydratase
VGLSPLRGLTIFSTLSHSPVVRVVGTVRMRFTLIDRIDAHQPGKFLRGCKFLALGEEYLADHFPRFPVMPGVLMLQAVAEAGAWLWRVSNGFQHTVITLREAKNVKYGSFMQPGRRLDVSVDLVKMDGAWATFKGKGADDGGQQTVSAHFVLHGYTLTEKGPAGAAADAKLLDHWKARWAVLTGELK